MLLTAKDVDDCHLIRRVGKDETEIIPGIIYGKTAFVCGASYPRDRRDEAIAEMRRRFLDPVPSFGCILLEGDDRVTIYYEDTAVVKLVEGEADIVAYINLTWLKGAISDVSTGIPSRQRHFRIQRYQFSAKDAVDWSIANLAISRDSGVKLGQRLLDHGIFVPLERQTVFSDDNSFYTIDN
jgi:hypothetical protein